jgi:hypothetical protein
MMVVAEGVEIEEVVHALNRWAWKSAKAISLPFCCHLRSSVS